MTNTRKARQKGSSVIELALIFPTLILLSLGVADFARVFHAAIQVSGAAKAGAQWGVFDPTHAADISGMQSAGASDAQMLGGVTVTARRYCQCGNGGEVACGTACIGSNAHRVYVRVTAQRPFRTLVRYPGIPSMTRLRSDVTMRVQ